MTTHIFRSGNSYAFRLTKADRQALKADADTVFEKQVSPDGNTITFTKVPEVRQSVMDFAEQFYNENETLMERLKDL